MAELKRTTSLTLKTNDRSLNRMDTQLFNALCDLVIYHFADVLRPEKTGSRKFAASVKLLVDRGIITGQDDTGSAQERYEEMVCEYALERLPDSFHRAYDYWGAACISDKDKGIKDGLYAGDSHGQIMFFDDFDALEEYTNDKLVETV